MPHLYESKEKNYLRLEKCRFSLNLFLFGVPFLDGKEDESDEENEDDKLIGGRLISNRSIPNLVAATENEERLIDSKLPSSIEINSSSSLLAHR